jgi:hypothetical protein
MLAADPTSVYKRAGADSGVVGQGRIKSSSVADAAEALATAVASGKGAALPSKATGAYFRRSVLGMTAAGDDKAAAEHRPAALEADGAVALDVEDLLRKAAALIEEVEAAYGTDRASPQAKGAAASATNPASSHREPARVGEADILRQGVAGVSTTVISATGSSASASWGGVRDLDEVSLGADRR